MRGLAHRPVAFATAALLVPALYGTDVLLGDRVPHLGPELASAQVLVDGRGDDDRHFLVVTVTDEHARSAQARAEDAGINGAYGSRPDGNGAEDERGGHIAAPADSTDDEWLSSLSAADQEMMTQLRDDGLDPRPAGHQGVVAGTQPAAAPVTASAPASPSAASTRRVRPDAPTPLDDHPATRDTRWLDDRRVAVTSAAPADAFEAHPAVESVEHDGIAYPYGEPDMARLWALDNTGQSVGGSTGVAGADIRWRDASQVATGAGVVVAVIDSGVDLAHPDLRGAWHRNTDEVCGNGIDDDRNGYVDDCLGWDFVNNDATVHDQRSSTVSNEHGTHVAGTIAARVNDVGMAGVAPVAQVMPLKVMENGSFPMSRAVEAIDYAVDNGADVINASWGTAPGGSPGPALLDALERAHAAGVLFVAAAGNSSTDIDTRPVWPASSDSEAVITVGASTNRDEMASFSNYGATSVDLFAPGQTIWSTLEGGYGYYSGTSMAAPHVAGVAALVAGQSDLSGAALRRHLMATTTPVQAFASRSVTGGRLNASVAVDEVTTSVLAEFVDFDGFAADKAHTAYVHVQVADPQVLAGAEPALRSTLAYRHDGRMYGVLEHPVEVSLTKSSRQVHSDDNAQLDLSDGPLDAAAQTGLTGDGLDIALRTELPAGQYALLVQVYDAGDPTQPTLGSSSAVAFTVVDPNAPAPPPEAPGSSDPDGPGSSQPDSPITENPDSPQAPDSGPAPSPDSPRSINPAPSPDRPGTTPESPDSRTPGEAPIPKYPDSPKAPDSGPAPSPDNPGPTNPAPTPDSPRPSEPAPTPDSPRPSEPAPTPDSPRPSDPQPPVSDGAYLVSPSSGPASGGTLVTISGPDIPARPYVHFGSTNASVLSVIEGRQVLVKTNPRLPGTVSVTISGGAAPIIIPNAFTYLDSNGNAPLPPADSTPDDGTGGSPPPAEDSPPPADGSPPPADDSPQDNPEQISPPAPKPRTAGKPFIAANGLKLDALTSADPLTRLSSQAWAGGGCTTKVCPAIIL